MSTDLALPGAAPAAVAEPGFLRRAASHLGARGLIGVALVAIVIILGLLAPLIAPYDPVEQIPDANLVPPSSEHLFGTDEVNRDVFSRTLYGSRVAILVALIVVPIGAAIGSLVGLLSTTWNVTDVIAQRIFDLILAFPTLILAIGLSAMIGPGLLAVALVIIAAEIPIFGRLIRTSVLSVRELPYVEASRVVGASNFWALRKHILPNSMEPLTVQLAISMSLAIFIEGAMSFLGIGVRPPAPSLGSLINDGMRNVYDSPYLAVGPLVIVTMLVLGFLLIAQSLARSSRV